MTIELQQNEDGVWLYRDPTQQGLAVRVLLLSGWAMGAFDAWLNEPSNWQAYPLIGKNLAFLRAELMTAYEKHPNQSEIIKPHAQKLLYAWQGARLLIEKRQRGKSQAARRAGKTKLSLEQEGEIALQFANHCGYGAIKALAAKFDVSEDTIRRVLARR
jgi:hypothetical protein